MRRHGKRVKVTAAAAVRLQDAAAAVERRYVLNHAPVSNLERVIEFELDGARMVRRLVVTVREIGREISVASPVGFKLANAQPGQQFEITRPGSAEFAVVNVLSVSSDGDSSVAQVTA